MATLKLIAIVIVGTIYAIFDVVLQLFTVVCALFGIYVMVALMVEWTTKLFKKHIVERKGPRIQARSPHSA